MASAWVHRRVAADGSARYRVEYRLGGRSTSCKYAGTFRSLRLANARRAWVAGELAAMRVPDLSTLLTADVAAPTVGDAAERWLASRVVVARGTRNNYVAHIALLAPLHRIRLADLEAADVADWIATTHAGTTTPDGKPRRRETIRKARQTLAMLLDHANVTPNPARDRQRTRLPREEPVELNPPTAEHVEAVFRLLPPKHRLPLLWLDWSGTYVGSIDTLRVGDYDEPGRRVRRPAATVKQRRAIWIDLPLCWRTRWKRS